MLKGTEMETWATSLRALTPGAIGPFTVVPSRIPLWKFRRLARATRLCVLGKTKFRVPTSAHVAQGRSAQSPRAPRRSKSRAPRVASSTAADGDGGGDGDPEGEPPPHSAVVPISCPPRL